MKRLKTILKITAFALIALSLAFFAFLYIKSPGTTPKFKDNLGKNIKNSIAKMGYVKIGGVDQFILIRGKSADNPVLLILHGGPGSSELPMYRAFNSRLEDHFTVVYWDQRGAGKSAGKKIPENSFTLAQLVEDTHELTVYLKDKLKKEKIFLLGHSWGSLLGVKTISKYPGDYFAYVGTGQFGNQPKSDSLSYWFALNKAIEKNDTLALKDLKEIGEYTDVNPEPTGFLNWLFTQRVYVSKFGGSTADPAAAVDIFVLPILNCKEYNIRDKFNMMKNNSKSAFLNSPYKEMIPKVLRTDLSDIHELQVPVFIFQGKNDYLTNYSVAREFYDSLTAPYKEFISFDKSAHFPPFEEPEKFDSLMINRVLKRGAEFINEESAPIQN
jgi:proline iminopeptidase